MKGGLWIRQRISKENPHALPAAQSRAITITWLLRRSLEARGYEVESTVSRELAAEEDAADVKGKGYWLRVEQLAGDTVRIRVRINTFETADNQRKAALLLEEIAKRL